MEQSLLQFGVAGLMGVLWIWERAHSRKRERQITETHQRLMQRDQQVITLIKLVRKNTIALVEFERTQRRLGEILEGMAHAMQQQMDR